jgi:signal transduction histidine kinase
MRLRAKFSILVSIIVILVFGVTFYRTSYFQNHLVINQAKRQARMLARQLLLTRKWVADHEGLFVISKPGVEKNPFLEDGEILDSTGQRYVKRNPAMVTRELSEYADQIDFCRFGVTSLKPVNPKNTPDSFERRGLLRFEKGALEVMDILEESEGRVLRYMIPLIVEESCLECHAEHGYKTGDVRGGLSLAIPISWADNAISSNNKMLLIIGILTTVFTSLGIFMIIDLILVRRLNMLSRSISLFPGKGINVEELPGGKDEVGELADNFKELGNRLLTSQDELEKTREQVFQSEKMAAIGRLAAGIAHEVNNPLGGMRNCVKSMTESPEDPELRSRYLDLIDKGLQRISYTVRQLLNFSRKEPLSLRTVNIDEIIRECFDLLEYQLKNIDLRLDLNLTDTQQIDVEALKQILVNLALNAIHAMPGGGALTVRTEESDNGTTITVADTGTGIKQEDLPNIFDPFFTTKNVGEGTGLGLSVTFSLVKKMGGTITVDSSPGKGAIFTFSIPIVDTPPATQ